MEANMTFDELWEVYRKRNAALRKDGGNVTLTVDNLRRLAKQAYEQGEKAAGNQAGATGPMKFIEDIFSGRRI
jgi:hypothetical protein